MAALPTFIPLPEAARKYGYDVTELREMAESGKIEAVQLPDGDVVVSEDSVQEKVRKEDLPEYQEYKHLAGVGISISKAASDYDIPLSTLYGWISRGHIAKIGRDGKRVLLNEQDVAYCAEIYYQRKGRGKRVFDSDGVPYKNKSSYAIPEAA